MPFCPYCGNHVEQEARFCTSCGKTLDDRGVGQKEMGAGHYLLWAVGLLFVAVAVLGVILVFDYRSKQKGNHVAVTHNGQGEDGKNNIASEPPDENRAQFPAGVDLAFYVDGSQLIESCMSIGEVRGILGEPRQEVRVSGDYYYCGDGIDISYPGLDLSFRPDWQDSTLRLTLFRITLPDHSGPRGIRVGDTVKSVLGKYPHNDLDREIIDEFTNAGITGRDVVLFYHHYPETTDDYVYHSYGLIHHAYGTGEINRIEFTCGILRSEFSISLNFVINNGLVEEIYCHTL